jgi:hypothetical protein
MLWYYLFDEVILIITTNLPNHMLMATTLAFFTSYPYLVANLFMFILLISWI